MENQSIKILPIESLNESLKMISLSLDKACKTGGYSLDEAFLLKTSCNNIQKCIENLDLLQKTFIKISENNKNIDSNIKNNNNKEDESKIDEIN